MKLSQAETILGALADKTRLRIVGLLAEGELCVCDLMRVLREPQSKVSRHLAYLRRSKMVEARKKELWMHYRLSARYAQKLRATLKTLSPDFQRDFQVFRKNKNCLVACCR